MLQYKFIKVKLTFYRVYILYKVFTLETSLKYSEPKVFSQALGSAEVSLNNFSRVAHGTRKVAMTTPKQLLRPDIR